MIWATWDNQIRLFRFRTDQKKGLKAKVGSLGLVYMKVYNSLDDVCEMPRIVNQS
jgi:hypothetical protein